MLESSQSVIRDPSRLKALRATALLDYAASEAAFDRLTRLAARLLGAPLAFVNLIDAERQISVGRAVPASWPPTEATPLADSFCRHVVETGEPLLIEDARADPRVRTSAFVRELGVASYAGAPLTTVDGHTLGTLCVADFHERSWTPEEHQTLADLAQLAMTEIALRRDIQRRAELELELVTARNELDQRVQARTADLTAARTELAHREAYFRALIEHTRDVVAVFESDGTLRYSGPALTRLYDYAPDALAGAGIFSLVHTDDVGAVRDAWDRARVAPGASSLVGCRLYGRDGRWRLHEMLLENLLDQPAVAGLVAHLRDISERQEIETQLRRSQDDLRQAEKMDAVGRLAGGIAHDFNNLLTVIISLGDMALAHLEVGSALHTDLADIATAARRAADLIGQLMAFSRRQVLQMQPVDLNGVVRDAHGVLGRLIGEDIRIVTELERTPWLVEADPGQMLQVLMNLAINARDAMAHGGVISISTRNVELSEIYARQHPEVVPGAHVMLAVSDTGVGMDTETQFRVFEPFFTTKGPGKGTGLGLATVYGIVKQMGGHIWLYSEPGQGTTFKIFLPRTSAGLVIRTPSSAPIVTGGGGETILLAEDEPGVRKLVTRVLRQHGYQVLPADSGPEALLLAAAHQGDIHCLLTDMVMPEMSGRELAARIRADRPTLPVVVMSGYTADEIDRRGLMEPGHQLLAKPFTPDLLASAVRSALEAASQARATRTADIDAAGTGAPGILTTEPARVMVVDDVHDNREVLTALLGGRYAVSTFPSGEAALEALEHELPDVVLLDIAMPGMSGLDVLARIRADTRWRHLPVVAITARAMVGDRERLIEAGFDNYMSKPVVDEQALFDVIDAQFERGGKRRPEPLSH